MRRKTNGDEEKERTETAETKTNGDAKTTNGDEEKKNGACDDAMGEVQSRTGDAATNDSTNETGGGYHDS